MSQWDGRSKGKVLGYKIFIFLIRNFGVRSAYFLLYFVAFYYVLFSRKGTQAMYYYFHNRLGYSPFKSYLKVFKNNYVFGQTIIDRVVIASGHRNEFTYEFDGVERILDLLKTKKGGIMISAHVGNFEIADYFFSEIDVKSQIHIVTTDNEHRAIKAYLSRFSLNSRVKYIIVQDDLSHIFEINAVLNRNGLVCFTGDRYKDGNRVIEAEFLGKNANFPLGTFLLGSRLNVPVLYVYVMKETDKHYHLYVREAKFKKRDPESLLKDYIKSIEGILKKYPYQWFNYFDFWNDIK